MVLNDDRIIAVDYCRVGGDVKAIAFVRSIGQLTQHRNNWWGVINHVDIGVGDGFGGASA